MAEERGVELPTINRPLEEILENLEQNNAAVNLMSVDFCKAFNSVDHEACLSAVQKHGGSQSTSLIVQSFLANRYVCVRIGDTLSDPLYVKGGCPQGTFLGNILFVIATNTLEDVHGENYVGLPEEEIAEVERIQNATDEPNNSCIRLHIDNRTLRYEMSSLPIDEPSVPYEEVLPDPDEKWTVKDPLAVKFLDDLSCAEKLNAPDSFNIFSTQKPRQVIRARKSEALYHSFENNGKEIGLKINLQKTQMICISAPINYEQSIFF